MNGLWYWESGLLYARQMAFSHGGDRNQPSGTTASIPSAAKKLFASRGAHAEVFASATSASRSTGCLSPIAGSTLMDSPRHSCAVYAVVCTAAVLNERRRERLSSDAYRTTASTSATLALAHTTTISFGPPGSRWTCSGASNGSHARSARPRGRAGRTRASARSSAGCAGGR